MVDLKKVKNILHLCVWIFGVCAAGCIAYLLLGDSISEAEFICAAVYGYCIVNTLLFADLFFEEEIPTKTMYLLTAGGAFLYLIAAVLLMYNIEDFNVVEIRAFLAGVFSAANGAIYLFEFIALLVKPSLLD